MHCMRGYTEHAAESLTHLLFNYQKIVEREWGGGGGGGGQETRQNLGNSSTIHRRGLCFGPL